MKLFLKLRCRKCPRKPDCDLAKAVIKHHDEWKRLQEKLVVCGDDEE